MRVGRLRPCGPSHLTTRTTWERDIPPPRGPSGGLISEETNLESNKKSEKPRPPTLKEKVTTSYDEHPYTWPGGRGACVWIHVI